MHYRLIHHVKSTCLLLVLTSLASHCSCRRNPNSSTSRNGSKSDELFENIQNSLTNARNSLTNAENHLVDASASANQVKEIGDQAFFLKAIQDGNAAAVKKYLDEGFDVNKKFPSGDTPLHVAIEKNKPNVAKVLLKDPKINIGLTNNANETPADLALENDNDTVMLLLIDEGKLNPSILGKSGYNVLHDAIRYGKKQVAKALVTNYPSFIDVPNKFGKSSLHLVMSYNHDLAKMMLAKEVDVNKKDSEGRTPLHYLVSSGLFNKDILSLLLDKGADINAKDHESFTPLHFLLESKLALNPLHISSSIAMINKVANINAQAGPNKDTYLHQAVISNNKEIVEALLKVKEIKTDIPNADGDTPLELAQKTIDTTKNVTIKATATEIRDLLLNAGK